MPILEAPLANVVSQQLQNRPLRQIARKVTRENSRSKQESVFAGVLIAVSGVVGKISGTRSISLGSGLSRVTLHTFA